MLLLSACAAPQAPADSPSALPSQAPEITTTPEASESVPPEQELAASSAGIIGGFIDPKYGVHGELKAGVPVVSLPIEIINAPPETVCFAVYMDDPDADFWTHWMAANIKERNLPEDYSRNASGDTVQGLNDFGTIGYGGPTPPKDHTYQITVYALDAPLGLQDGFSYDDFDGALSGHILAYYTFEGVYKK